MRERERWVETMGLNKRTESLKRARMTSAAWRVIQTVQIPVSMTGPKRGHYSCIRKRYEVQL